MIDFGKLGKCIASPAHHDLPCPICCRQCVARPRGPGGLELVAGKTSQPLGTSQPARHGDRVKTTGFIGLRSLSSPAVVVHDRARGAWRGHRQRRVVAVGRGDGRNHGLRVLERGVRGRIHREAARQGTGGNHHRASGCGAVVGSASRTGQVVGYRRIKSARVAQAHGVGHDTCGVFFDRGRRDRDRHRRLVVVHNGGVDIVGFSIHRNRLKITTGGSKNFNIEDFITLKGRVGNRCNIKVDTR